MMPEDWVKAAKHLTQQVSKALGSWVPCTMNAMAGFRGSGC
jgi:hypothetical protein